MPTAYSRRCRSKTSFNGIRGNLRDSTKRKTHCKTKHHAKRGTSTHTTCNLYKNVHYNKLHKREHAHTRLDNGISRIMSLCTVQTEPMHCTHFQAPRQNAIQNAANAKRNGHIVTH